MKKDFDKIRKYIDQDCKFISVHQEVAAYSGLQADILNEIYKVLCDIKELLGGKE